MRKTLLAVALLIAVPFFGVAWQAPLDWTKIPGARIQVLIQEQTPQGQYNDALYYSPADWDKVTEKDISDAKKARMDNWLASVVEQSGKPPVIPTKEELKESAIAQVEQVDRAVAALVATDIAKEDVQALIDKLQKQIDDLKAKVGIEVKPGEVIVP